MTRVAVIGAGLAGTAVAMHLLREGAAGVVLIEREREPGRGTAYGTRRPEHLLNVPARRMSVWPDDPTEFARWWERRGGDAEDYAARMLFGDYICELMTGAAERIETVSGEAVDVGLSGGREAVRLRDGRTVEAEAVVLALGNLRPAPLPGLDPRRLGAAYVEDPWYGGLADGLAADDVVLLVGTGLTAIDAALTLDALGFRGRILALSRRGLAPRANLPREPVAEPLDAFPRSAVSLARAVRRRAREIGWRESIHEVRQAAQRIWREAPVAERRRFLRHLRPWWDVHRHRIAPAVARRIDEMRAEGRLRFAAGRIVAAEPDGAGADVTWRPRGADRPQRLRAARIVNCSGPELDIGRAGEPLLDTLIAGGRIRPDACRLGIDVDEYSRALDSGGTAGPSLYAIGPMTRGALWESIAVSDIGVQAQAVARTIMAPAKGASR